MVGGAVAGTVVVVLVVLVLVVVDAVVGGALVVDVTVPVPPLQAANKRIETARSVLNEPR